MTIQDTLRSADPTLDALEARVLGEIAEMLRDVIGEEYVVDMEITMDTSFNEDLELESIEFVTLADRMRVTYGDQVDFVGFLAEMDVDRVINMRVGEVVHFIADSLRAGAKGA
ncbi:MULTISPECIES: acyl carrier protein [Pseudofrankia]|uniref:Acyl carrier protein n=1 Tax=Pseudofrankia asymbiotica TaxID=1834516 RepID=A0A1V2ICU7_9ACTN|nr:MULTISPECIES: acyl carrier protein [Pseudofrankia]MDT3440036.1 acyl carrier protein [Pseudofrankia sp. BMG5.37]OHV44666.1 acyl carrier protein [Pseudofrankia sp. BMG5.36]ONH31018.1 acyl carrier protein [Pseudofrankia asymbiotica]